MPGHGRGSSVGSNSRASLWLWWANEHLQRCNCADLARFQPRAVLTCPSSHQAGGRKRYFVTLTWPPPTTVLSRSLSPSGSVEKMRAEINDRLYTLSIFFRRGLKVDRCWLGTYRGCAQVFFGCRGANDAAPEKFWRYFAAERCTPLFPPNRARKSLLRARAKWGICKFPGTHRPVASAYILSDPSPPFRFSFSFFSSCRQYFRESFL